MGAFRRQARKEQWTDDEIEIVISEAVLSLKQVLLNISKMVIKNIPLSEVTLV
ncbi:hypothetical protein [Pontimicrobium sp. MEBiC06410]